VDMSLWMIDGGIVYDIVQLYKVMKFFSLKWKVNE